jgi:hypothetical protein
MWSAMNHLGILVLVIGSLVVAPAAGAVSLLNSPQEPLGTEPVYEGHFIFAASSLVRPYALIRHSRRFGELGPHLDVRLRNDGLHSDVQLAPTNPERLIGSNETESRPISYAKAGVRIRFVHHLFVDFFVGYQHGDRGLVRAGVTFGLGAPPPSSN